MTTFARQFASVFFIGFIALAIAIGYAVMAGGVGSPNPYLIALRNLGIGFMAAGMALWIVSRRTEAGKPGLNGLLGMLVGGGTLLLVLGLVFGNLIAGIAGTAGLAFMFSALVLGLLAMLISPAYPRPLTTQWPEGGLEHPDPHIPAEELHRIEGHPVEPDDLTRIEGIGPKIQSILNQAGIDTYLEVASRSAADLRDLLKIAHFNAPVDASTWPEQAALAARGDWASLDAFQKQLTAGRAQD